MIVICRLVRVALLAKTLASSTLTLKIWAVRDCAQLVAQVRPHFLSFLPHYSSYSLTSPPPA